MLVDYTLTPCGPWDAPELLAHPCNSLVGPATFKGVLMQPPKSVPCMQSISPENLKNASAFGLTWNEVSQIYTILLAAYGKPITLQTVLDLIAQIQAVLHPAQQRLSQQAVQPK